MTTAYWCVFVAMLLPIVWAGAAKAGAKAFDNARPRDYLARLDGWRQRANWAQANSYESFPAFAAGVIIAHLAGAAQPTIDMLALGYVLARILYGIFYIADRPTLRSLVWVASLGCIVGLFVSAA
ncbi:MAG: MAPEG family protein [Gammaproteobacteria bacterium]